MEDRPAAPDQLFETWRATDEISFNLLRLIPLVSATGIGVVAQVGLPVPMSVFVSAFAAVLTFALYQWERRNIATCNTLRDRLVGAGLVPRPRKPTLLGREIGKTEAEHVVYVTTIVAWSILPGFVARHDGTGWSSLAIGYAVAVGVTLAAACTWLAVGKKPARS